MPQSPADNPSQSASQQRRSDPKIEAILLFMFPHKLMADAFASMLPDRDNSKPFYPELYGQVNAQREKLLALSEPELREIWQRLDAIRRANEKASAAEKKAAAESKLVAAEAAKFYNKATPDAVFLHWSKMESWTFDEAIALLLAKDPKVVTWQAMKVELGLSFSLGLLTNTNDRPPPSDFVRQYGALRELADRAKVLKTVPLKPIAALAWAHRSGAIEPPQPLTRYVLARVPKVIEAPQPASNLPVETATKNGSEKAGKSKSHTVKKWIPEKVAALQADSDAHGTAIAALNAGISDSRVKQILQKPAEKKSAEKKTASSVFDWGGDRSI